MPWSGGDEGGTLTSRFLRWLISSFAIAIALILVATRSFSVSEPNTLLEQVVEERRLVVLTRNAPTTFYLERDEMAGFEYDLVRAFARHLGVKVGFDVRDSVPELIDGLASGEGHIAAAAFSKDIVLPERVAFGPTYGEVRLQLVCHRDGPAPRSVDDSPVEPVKVLVESSFEGRLPTLKSMAPVLGWTAVYGPSTEDLMGQVAAREVDCTVGDSTLVAVHRRNFPELIVPFDVTMPKPLGWIVPSNAAALQAELDHWFALPSTRKLIATLEERYYGHVPDFDYVDFARFERRIGSRLPRYHKHFVKAAEKTGLPWTLLAAVSYQESHWRPNARSYTGVRGLMMLTLSTADDLGVTDRLDPEQSIDGGARYLARLLRRVPKGVKGEDRLWFALAAYNVGFGHMMDARILARRQGLDPDRWTDVKRVLPLLSQKAYYRTVPHGFARGAEPVRYVQQVRHYLDILERREGRDA